MSELTDFQEGIIHAVVMLQKLHDQPTAAADILKECGLDNVDCSDFDGYDKEALIVINEEHGMRLKGL
ncbi:TPA: hypothetical protein P1K35_000276 [Providencia rettgeri]|uniref:hypothetical protein n=1 Tax=Providencia sp. PROV259 TaxID=2949947 RepID=UPI00234AB764|nr:hypothetical protein [Providencia sp. PROV259]